MNKFNEILLLYVPKTAVCDSTAKFRMGKGESPWHMESALVGAVKGIPRIIIIPNANRVSTKVLRNAMCCTFRS